MTGPEMEGMTDCGSSSAEDVVASGAIHLGEGVDAGQVSGAGELDAGGGGGDLLLRRPGSKGNCAGPVRPPARRVSGCAETAAAVDESAKGSSHRPSINSRKSSLTFSFAAARALRPCGVAR